MEIYSDREIEFIEGKKFDRNYANVLRHRIRNKLLTLIQYIEYTAKKKEIFNIPITVRFISMFENVIRVIGDQLDENDLKKLKETLRDIKSKLVDSIIEQSKNTSSKMISPPPVKNK